MPWKSFRSESKRDWGQTVNVGQEMCADQVKQGALLRIADAVEIMAQNHKQLIEERDLYCRWWKEERVKCRGLEKVVSGLQGFITRLKNKGK